MNAFELNPVGSPYGPSPVQPGFPSQPVKPVENEKPEPIREEPVREPMTKEEILEEIDHVNEILENVGHRLKFGFYEQTGQFYVQVIDRSRDQVVKMMPPEYLLSLRARLVEAVGLIVDEAK